MHSKNILIITYSWPPRNAVSVHRPYSWAKYWSASGNTIHILTAVKYKYDAPLDLHLPELENVNITEIAYRNAGRKNQPAIYSNITDKSIKILKRLKIPLQHFLGARYDIRDKWARYALKSLTQIIEQFSINIVVSTYGPRASHYIGSAIKQAHPNIIWIADYRDLWSIRHDLELNSRQILHEQHNEQKTLRSADLITTVSPYLSNQMEDFLNKKTLTIYNGFDTPISTDIINLPTNISDNHGIIRIVYTGAININSRNPTPLFLAVNSLIADGTLPPDRIRIEFYGNRIGNLKTIIHNNNANKYTIIHGHVNYHTALDAQRRATALLLLESSDKKADGVLTGKLFEYIASGTPIISIGSRSISSIAKIINETGTGIICEDNINRIRKVILHLSQGDRKLIYNPSISSINNYSRKSQAERFLSIIDSI